MKLRRKVAAIMLIASMVVCGASAQEDSPPDLRMLMNLDLFEPRSNGTQAAPGPGGAASPDDSLFSQIRTLNAMGYLGNQPGAGGNGVPRGVPRAPESAGAQPELPVGAPRPAPAEPESAIGGTQSEPPPPQSEPAGQPNSDVEGPLP